MPEIGTVFRIETKPVPAPILSAPANGQTVWSDQSVTFSWWSWNNEAVHLQVSTQPDMSDVFWEASNVKPGVSSAIKFPSGIYYWRVTDTLAQTSDIGHFEAGTPQAHVSTPVFSTVLSFSDGGTEQALTAGMAAGASTGFDTGIDQLAPPPPPSGVLDVRFVRNGENYIADIVGSTSESTSWILSISHGSQPITVSWDQETLPANGSLRLRDTLGGSLIDAYLETTSSLTIPSGLSQLELVFSKQVQVISTIRSGWNLVGLPLEPPSFDYSVLFPGAISQTLFEYSGAYSTPLDGRMNPGTGYWLRFGGDGFNTLEGTPRTAVTAALKSGWNLISPPNCAFNVSQITPQSPLLPGTSYGYEGSYQPTSEMKPGKGYWIRTSESANITMDCSVPPAPPGKREGFLDLSTFAQVQIEDAAGQPTVVYISNTPASRLLKDSYTVPPTDPIGGWQPSFENGMYVSVDGNGVIDLQQAAFPITLRLLGSPDRTLQVALLGPQGLIESEHAISPDKPLTVSEADVSAARLSTDDISHPSTFEAHPIFPNPASTRATFQLDLPSAQRITAEVYDMIGRRVAVLSSNELMRAGSHTMDLEIGHLSSGTYVVRVQAESGTETLKLTLVK